MARSLYPPDNVPWHSATPERLLALAADAGIVADLARAIIDQTRDALAHWPTLARAHGVAAGTVQLVSGRLGA